jgi:hypothetical protein
MSKVFVNVGLSLDGYTCAMCISEGVMRYIQRVALSELRRYRFTDEHQDCRV